MNHGLSPCEKVYANFRFQSPPQFYHHTGHEMRRGTSVSDIEHLQASVPDKVSAHAQFYESMFPTRTPLEIMRLVSASIKGKRYTPPFSSGHGWVSEYLENSGITFGLQERSLESERLVVLHGLREAVQKTPFESTLSMKPFSDMNVEFSLFIPHRNDDDLRHVQRTTRINNILRNWIGCTNLTPGPHRSEEDGDPTKSHTSALIFAALSALLEVLSQYYLCD